MLVMYTESTHAAIGVAAEGLLSKEEESPYVVLKGREDKACTVPSSPTGHDGMCDWTLDNLKRIIDGAR